MEHQQCSNVCKQMQADAAAYAAAAPCSTQEANSVLTGVDSLLQADPNLDDLELVAQYEARIDRENGWDVRNLDTFGESECDHDALVHAVFGESAQIVPGLGASKHFRPWCSKSCMEGRSDCVISRGIFLAGRAQSIQSKATQGHEMHGSHTMKSVVLSMLLQRSPPTPPVQPPGPPGLEPPVEQMSFGRVAFLGKVQNDPLPEKQPIVDFCAPEPEPEKQPTGDLSVPETMPVVELPVPEPAPQQFKVLLQNLPETINKSALRLMLRQAQLEDVVDLTVRANGKALVTFTTKVSVGACIKYFHGWWATAYKPVIAVYVQTVKNLGKRHQQKFYQERFNY